MVLVLLVLVFSIKVISSTYLRVRLQFSVGIAASLIMLRKVAGPVKVPCGTPALSTDQLEREL